MTPIVPAAIPLGSRVIVFVEDAQTKYQVQWVGEYDLSYKGGK